MGAQAHLQKPGALRVPACTACAIMCAHLCHAPGQMDHWRLDEDEASFEDDRLERLRQQQAEKARLDEESAQFYQLARASRERKVTPAPAAPPAPSLDSGPPAEKRKRRDAQLPAFKVHKKVADAPRARAPAAAPAAAPVEAPAGCGGGLPGMDAYGDDDSD